MRGRQSTSGPRIRSVKFNVLMNMILVTSSFIFPLITIPYVSRVLLPSGMGAVSWAQSLVGYFSLIAVLGIPSYGVRECAKVRDDREELSQVVQELMAILLISTAIIYILFLICVFTVPKMHADVPLMLIFSTTIWLSSCGVEWFYQAIEQYEYITIRNIAMKALSLLLMFLLVRSKFDYRIYAFVLVIGSYGSNVINLLRLRTFVTFKARRKLKLFRHFKPMVSFAVSKISSGIYTQIDIVLLGFLSTTTATGLYQIVVKIKSLCITAVNSVSEVMLPRLSYYVGTEKNDQAEHLMAKNLNFLTVVGLAAIVLLVVCADPIIMVIAGSKYISSANALRIISPSILFASLNSILSQYLIVRGRETSYALVNVAGLVIGVALEFGLIPHFGFLGAALGVTLCEFFALAIRVIMMRGLPLAFYKEFDAWKIILAAIVSFLFIGLIQMQIRFLPSLWQLLILILGFSVIYFGLLCLLRERFICGLLFRKHNSLLSTKSNGSERAE